MDARALVVGAGLLLVDFDGPLARLFPGGGWLEVSARVREEAGRLGGPELLGAVADEPDHVQVLRTVAGRAPEHVAPLTDLATRLEVQSARTVGPATHAIAFLEDALARGAAVAVVTNNAPEVVRMVLDRARPGLTDRLAAVLGRRPERLADLKPSPAMLLTALVLTGVRPGAAVFLGDSVTDVQAGSAAGVPVVGVAEEVSRRHELVAAGAVAAVPDVGHLLAPGPGTTPAGGAAPR